MAIEHGDVVSQAEDKARRLRVLGEEARDPRERGHEPGKDRARVREARRLCNFQEPVRGVLLGHRAYSFPSSGGSGPSLFKSFSRCSASSSLAMRLASLSSATRRSISSL